MLKKKINGSWENVKNVVKRKTNGTWVNCSKVRKKYNGSWSDVLNTENTRVFARQFMKESEDLPTSDELDRMEASYTSTTTQLLDDGIPYIRGKLGSRTGTITCSYMWSISTDVYLQAGEKLYFEYRFSCSGSSYWGKIKITYWDEQSYERKTEVIVPKTYNNQQNFQIATFTASRLVDDGTVYIFVGNSNSSCLSSNYGIMDLKGIYNDSYVYQLYT